MATCANDKYVFTIKHLGTQASTVVHVAHNVTVEYVILKASASLELEVDERPKLELVHQGDILPKNQKIQVSGNIDFTVGYLMADSAIKLPTNAWANSTV